MALTTLGVAEGGQVYVGMLREIRWLSIDRIEVKVPSPMINTGGRHTLTSKDPLPLTHSLGPDDPEFGG